MKDKLKPPQADAAAPAETAPGPPEAKPDKPFVAAGSRTTSKGSLLNPEGGSSMASTVMDIVSRKTSASAAGTTASAEATASQRKTSSSSGPFAAIELLSGSSSFVSRFPILYYYNKLEIFGLFFLLISGLFNPRYKFETIKK